MCVGNKPLGYLEAGGPWTGVALRARFFFCDILVCVHLGLTWVRVALLRTRTGSQAPSWHLPLCSGLGV